jgi:DNA-binding MarR family transcriptional regulator
MTTGRDIARGLRKAYMLMHRQTQSLLSGYGYTAVQYVLLALLKIEDGITQQELTRRASSDANTVRATLLLLERDGMVVRRSHKTDRRARRILLTDKGRRTYSKLSAELKPLQDALLSSFNAEEAETLVANLNHIAEAMRQWEQRSELRLNSFEKRREN